MFFNTCIFSYSSSLLHNCFIQFPHFSNMPDFFPRPDSQPRSLLPHFLRTDTNSHHHNYQHGAHRLRLPMCYRRWYPLPLKSISSLMDSISFHLLKDITSEICLFPSYVISLSPSTRAFSSA